MANKLTHQEFMDKFKERNEHFDDIEVLGEYVNAKTKIKCRCRVCGNEWDAYSSNLLKGHGCFQCGAKLRGNNQRLSHKEFISRVSMINPNITVIGEYVGRSKTVECKCNVCDYEWKPRASAILDGEGCPYCSGRACRTGYNDIATTYPHLVQYFVNIEDAKTHTAHSNQKIFLKCPDCGYEKFGRIQDLTTQGFGCIMCSDSLSYPNKFIRQMFSQLSVDDVDFEYKPKWARLYRFDCYFEYQGVPYLIEMDGAVGHGEIQYKSTKRDTEGLQRDLIKNELAKVNGIELIRIDCKKSDRKYISKNIVNSRLSEILDLSQIDWTKCDRNSQKNLVKEVCDYYEETHEKLSVMSKIFKISEPTVRTYLRKGNEFGWCNYN